MNHHRRFRGLLKGALIGCTIIAGTALVLAARRRNGATSRRVARARDVRRTGRTIGWIAMYSVASAVAGLADGRLKRLQDASHV